MRRPARPFVAVAADSQPSAAPPILMPLDAPPQEEPLPDSAIGSGEKAECEAEIGADAAARLVERCIAVSPATRPPCNAANPCALIRDEIDRSCAMYEAGETRPAECTPSDTPAR
ncbi:hypothetical protein [Brevundimonas sp. NIBR10]|uniref:hypothetical protein n=1 Tax=Brevundimonas sp. NIBR10 TaxID=3015997 RepID=UPI0022F1C70E|nr:hypothetical protein [Brevundimonas sp. NIBR10]